MSRLFLMPSSVQRAISLSGLLHPVPSSSRLRIRGPTAAVSRVGPALWIERCSSCCCCMVESSRVRPELPLGPNKHLLLLEFVIWISRESQGDPVRSLNGPSHVPNWTKPVLLLEGSHLTGAGSCPLSLCPGEQAAAGDQAGCARHNGSCHLAASHSANGPVGADEHQLQLLVCVTDQENQLLQLLLPFPLWSCQLGLAARLIDLIRLMGPSCNSLLCGRNQETQNGDAVELLCEPAQQLQHSYCVFIIVTIFQ